MDGGRGQEDVNSGLLCKLDRLPGAVDVAFIAPCQAADRRAGDLGGDGPDRLEVADRSDGKPRLDDVDPQGGERRAISSFSAMFMLAPGDCSPSRNVVSKIRTRLASDGDAGTVDCSGWVLLMIRLFPRFVLMVRVSRITMFDHIVRLRRSMETRGSKSKKPRDPPGGRVSGLRWLDSSAESTNPKMPTSPGR